MPLNSAHASYDEVPYQGGISAGTHPEHLAALGRLFGMRPAPADNCRVLEIGCATGGNLLPMAYSLPESTFVGIDPAERQIELGRAVLAEYGVSNVELTVADVRYLANWDREFDYIVCHGVFSWVTAPVRDTILDTCRRLLAPQGIAFISYNALPGFHLRAGVGEMLRYHARNFPDPGERTDQGIALLDFLVTSTSQFAGSDAMFGLYHGMLRYEQALLRQAPSYYLMHEHLEDESTAFYLHQFASLAERHGLQYLGDSAFSTMLARDLPDDVASSLNEIAPTQLHLEQYKDFVVNRMFRRSLVCRDDVQLERHISVEAIRSLSFRNNVWRETDKPWRILKAGGQAVEVSDPTVVATLDVLEAARPASLSFDAVHARVSEIAPLEADHLAAILLSLYSLDAVEFRTWTPPVAGGVSERPLAFWPARRAATGGSRSIPVPYHAVVELDPFICKLLPLVDGKHDHASLAAGLERMARAGILVFDGLPEGETLTPEDYGSLVTDALELLRRAGLLIS